MSAVKTSSSSFSSWLYPSRCALCATLGDEAICTICRQDFEAIDAVVRYDGPLSLATTLYRYEGRVAQAVRRLKYSRATALSQPLSEMMHSGMERLGLHRYDHVVPVPLHWMRRCHRGFNQAELLVEQCASVDKGLLRRVRYARPQAQLSREARLQNLSGAFRASPSVEGKTILLVDDVITYGATVRECAKALRDAGAAEVGALALAGDTY